MDRILLAAWVIGCFVPTAAQDVKSAPASVSPCELVENASRYHGQVVQVRGRIYPAMIDTPFALVDSSCSKGIRIDFDRSVEAEKDQGYREFRRYLNELRSVEATVSGRFEMVLIPSAEPVLRFRLLRIADVVPGPPLLPLRCKR